jgi:hypothetical protein
VSGYWCRRLRRWRRQASIYEHAAGGQHQDDRDEQLHGSMIRHGLRCVKDSLPRHHAALAEAGNIWWLTLGIRCETMCRS